MLLQNHISVNMSQNEAILKLMKELSKGKRSGEEISWITSEEVKAHFEGQNLEG